MGWSGLRVAALFLMYGTVGYAGDYAVGLLGYEPDLDFEFRHEFRHEAEDDDEREVIVDVRVDPDIDVDVDTERDVRVDVQVRHSDDCRFELDRDVQVAAASGATLRIDAGSGELRVEGRRGLDRVQAVGRVCASHEEFVDDLRLTAEVVGGDIVLTAHYPDQRDWRGRRTARIDLTVEVPLNMPVDIDDSSGSMFVMGTGDLRIDDSSGDIRVEGINGSVTIDDSSGGLQLADIAGDVDVEDGSGGIDIHDVQGVVRVRDGSGGIEVTEVERDVIIEADGSGSIVVRGIGGDFRVERDGSGSIRYDDVRGEVDVPRKERRRRGH